MRQRNSRQTPLRRSARRAQWVSLVALAALGVAAPGDLLGERGTADAADRTHEDLLTTYSLLDSALSDE